MASWSAIKRIPKSYPLAFGIVFSTFKTSFSDLLVQKTIEKRDNIDWRRNAAFASFGCFYLGGVQYGLYVKLFGRLFPTSRTFTSKSVAEKLKDKVGMKETGYQVFIDQFVHHPLLYFPVFYATKELVVNKDKPDLYKAIVTDYFGTNLKDDLFALWKIWVPSTIINFSFMPMWGRIPWVASTSLIWTCILSMMRGGSDDIVIDDDEVIGPHVSGKTMKIYSGAYEPRLCPVDIDPSLSHIVVSASGTDKKGLVHRMSQSVADAGGNITTSKMHRLGDQFVIVMHVSYDASAVRHLDLLESIRSVNEELIVKVQTLRPRQTKLRSKAAHSHFTLHSLGPDRPGVIGAYTKAFLDYEVNIESLSSEVRMVNGERCFVVDIEASDYDGRTDVKDFQGELAEIKDRLGVKTARLQRSTLGTEEGYRNA